MISLADETASKLRDAIRGGEYSVGQRLSDEHSLADRFGISRGTLRQALSILGDERLIVRHQGRGTFISNPTVSNKTDSAALLLGIMVFEKEHYFGRVIQGASAHASKRGYMLITGSNATESLGKQHTDAFLKNSIRGVIMTPRASEPLDNYNRLCDANIPVVLLDQLLPGRQEDFVSVDDHSGTYMATQYLIEAGHKRIGYAGTSDRATIPCQPNRYLGYADACFRAGITPRKEWIVESSESDATAAIKAVLDSSQRPTALVTFSDRWAIWAVNVARNLGLRVPEDISVIGFDDSTLAQNYDIPITSVLPAFKEIGVTVIDMLIDRIENGPDRPRRSILIAPTLSIRESTSAPTGAA